MYRPRHGGGDRNLSTRSIFSAANSYFAVTFDVVPFFTCLVYSHDDHAILIAMAVDPWVLSLAPRVLLQHWAVSPGARMVTCGTGPHESSVFFLCIAPVWMVLSPFLFSFDYTYHIFVSEVRMRC